MKIERLNICSAQIGDHKYECDNAHRNKKYSFQDGKCYQDGEYYGKVVYGGASCIQVEVDNGNMYMTGEIVTFHIHLTD